MNHLLKMNHLISVVSLLLSPLFLYNTVTSVAEGKCVFKGTIDSWEMEV